MLCNILNKKSNNLFRYLTLALIIAMAYAGIQSLNKTIYAYSQPDPIQLGITVEIRTQFKDWANYSDWAEYKVKINQPQNMSIRGVNIAYKVISRDDNCDASATWFDDAYRHKFHRNVIFDKWHGKPNYLLFLKNSILKYLGQKFCFRISKDSVGNQTYLDGYAEYDINKWWDDVELGGACPNVYAWIDDSTIDSGGQTTLRWKITNVKSTTSVHVTAYNHEYGFWDTSYPEPNIKKQYGNPHEVSRTYNHATKTITAFRTVIGHLPPRTDNLYIVTVRDDRCPVVRDAVFMRVLN